MLEKCVVIPEIAEAALRIHLLIYFSLVVIIGSHVVSHRIGVTKTTNVQCTFYHFIVKYDYVVVAGSSFLLIFLKFSNIGVVPLSARRSNARLRYI